MKCTKCGQVLKSKDCCRTGKQHFLFNWVGGGYNDTHADDAEDACRKAALVNPSLVPEPASFRLYTYEGAEHENRSWDPYD